MMFPLRVLHVEDDPDETDIFSSFLSPRKDLILEKFFDSGSALFAYLDNLPAGSTLPGLIFLDHNMPRVTGYQVLQQLKASDRFSAMPVVVISTYVDPDLEHRSLAAGALAVFSKPLTAAGYSQMIDEILALLARNQD